MEPVYDLPIISTLSIFYIYLQIGMAVILVRIVVKILLSSQLHFDSIKVSYFNIIVFELLAVIIVLSSLKLNLVKTSDYIYILVGLMGNLILLILTDFLVINILKKIKSRHNPRP